jgi:hypothetical protein
VVDLLPAEAEKAANATAQWLHQRLMEAMAQIAHLTGQVAVLEHRLANPPKQPPPEAPDAP